MQKSKILLGIIIVLTISFIGFQVFNLENIANVVRSLILPLLTVLYCMHNRTKNSYFFYFLLAYSISEFMGLFIYFAQTSVIVDNIIFYGGNVLYIFAYIFLIVEVLRSMDLKGLFRRFPVHIAILLAMDIYSVIFVTDIAVKSGRLDNVLAFAIEITYNISIMVLLTITLINYISRDSKKAMNLLVGALCIVFSEVIQVAYFYVSDINLLSVIYSVLLVFAFGFFYLQSSMEYIKEKNYETLEKLEA